MMTSDTECNQRPRFSRRALLEGLAGYRFVFPALTLIAVFTFFPIVYGLS